MIYKWETEKERLLRFMRISPKKKLEWLWQMHEFIRLSATKRRKAIFVKLRESR